MSDTKEQDFEVTLIVRGKHAILYELSKRLGGVRALASELDINPATLSNWIHLRNMPNLSEASRGGVSMEKRRAIALKLVQLTGRPIEEIFPNYVRSRLTGKSPRMEVTQSFRPTVAYSPKMDGYLTGELSGEGNAERAELCDAIAKAINQLPDDKWKEIVKLRFGLTGRVYSIKEVARMFSISASRVQQIERKAIRRMQSPHISCDLVDHLDD